MSFDNGKATNSQVKSSSERLLEYNYKKLQASFKKLTTGLTTAQSELEDYRKKERIFNLHKRCSEDQTKKLETRGKKLQSVEISIKEKNETLSKL